MLKFVATPSFKQDINFVFATEEQLKKAKLNLSAAQNKSLLNLLKNNKLFTAGAQQHCELIIGKNYVCVVGLGKAKELTPTQLRIIVRKALLGANTAKAKSIGLIPHDKSQETITAVVEAVNLGTYVWDKYKSAKGKKTQLRNQNIIIAAAKTISVDRVLKTCAGVNLARDLVNENAGVANSKYLEKTVRAFVAKKRNAKLTVLNKAELKRKGLGLHLAVNQGSINDPKLIIVEYKGAGRAQPYTAFVGKGLTFDTGGLNLKPTGGIENMRMDMGGAAAVIGTLKNVLALNVKKNILFVVGAAENVTGSKAYKPGDVIVGYAKKSVEVLNTDAEGRLVLADAISYTLKNYKVKTLIDAATLTGACIVALGYDYTGLVSNNDKLAESLLKSADTTDDRAWRLPLYPELKSSVSSQIADIANLGRPKGAGGTITAAEFLHQFVGKTHWAHLDIAGTSFVDGHERMYFGHGATGSGVRLMTHYLSNN